MEDVIYFELNNWTPGLYYPDEEPFLSWMHYNTDEEFTIFENMDFVEENKLVVSIATVEMSIALMVIAPRSWVEEKCPNLLTKYSKFIRNMDEDKWNTDFGFHKLPYNENTIGHIFFDPLSDDGDMYVRVRDGHDVDKNGSVFHTKYSWKSLVPRIPFDCKNLVKLYQN